MRGLFRSDDRGGTRHPVHRTGLALHSRPRAHHCNGRVRVILPGSVPGPGGTLAVDGPRPLRRGDCEIALLVDGLSAPVSLVRAGAHSLCV